MRIFKYKRFFQFAKKEHIENEDLRDIVSILEKGQFDADLGGGVFKMRLARSGEGKSSGYRVMVFFKSGERTFFVHGFAKSETANISKKELVGLKKLAKILFAMTDIQIQDALKKGILEEIKEDKQ